MKKVISLILAICMLFGVCAISANASSTYSLKIAGQETLNTSTGEIVTPSDTGWTLTTNTNDEYVLTLNNASISYGSFDVIYSVVPLKIVAIGDNSIVVPPFPHAPFAIHTDDSFTIEGTGTLEILGAMDLNSLTINGSPTIISGQANYTAVPVNTSTLLANAINWFYTYISFVPAEASTYEPDPETDVKIGDFVYPFKYGNNTVVINENYYRDITESNNLFFEVDVSNSNAKIDTAIIPNKVVKLVNDAGKGIMFKNKYAYAVIDRPVFDNGNSIAVKLCEDVATYAQIKAMDTTHVVSELALSCTANGKSIEGNVKVYVPCDIENPRVFYIIDEHTIGEWECEVKDGWCIFDRYLDGTYVVVK